jgi:ArsR family transcriptional regulator
VTVGVPLISPLPPIPETAPEELAPGRFQVIVFAQLRKCCGAQAGGCMSPDNDTTDERVFERLADYCSVMANPKRLAILWFLANGERSVGAIAEAIGVTIQNASQHLRVMRDRGAVENRQEGQTVLYRISSPKFLQASRLVREALAEQRRRSVEL